MSTSNPSSEVVQLPKGVTVEPGRETAQTNRQGLIVQGMDFPITLPNGSTTSVFIPYDEIHDTGLVAEKIAERVDAIMAVHNLS